MTDPVAEAAAKIAADAAPSSTEPSLLEKAMDTIHDLEAKVEHLIHPEAVSVGIESKSSLETAPVASAAIAEAGSAAAGEPVLAATVEASTPTLSASLDSTSAAATPESAYLAPGGSTAEAPNVSDSSTGTLPESKPSADTSIETGSATSSGGELPNAALAAVAQPVIAASAEPALTPVGIPGIVASSVAEPVKLASAASSAIKAGIANIKHHLSIRGFEQSAVADIHAELDAIEKWL